MRSPTAVDDTALQQLVRLVRLAETTGLRLDITGLAAYRRADTPPWYDTLSDEKARWAAQGLFWSAVAARVGSSPAIFCYNLMNEPAVPHQRLAPGGWQDGEFGGFHFVQFVTFDPAGRSPEQVASAWIDAMVAAIRAHDSDHLVTVGEGASAVGFTPRIVASHADFVSLHIYPRAGAVDAALGSIRTAATSKPIVVEETANLYCSIDELRAFVLRSRGAASGWMGFYWGETEAELHAEKTIPAALKEQWLRLFRELTPAIEAS